MDNIVSQLHIERACASRCTWECTETWAQRTLWYLSKCLVVFDENYIRPTCSNHFRPHVLYVREVGELE
jgi:hypothetical protein